MNTLSPTEAAYIAGIVDGEGTVLVTRVRRPENRCGYRFYPVVSVVSTSYEMLDYLQKTIGIGKINKKLSPSALKKQKRHCWTWSLKYQIAGDFLKQIEPYMIIKKDSARNAIEFCEASISRANYGKFDLEKMEHFWKKSSELNARGDLIDPEDKPITSQGRAMAEMRKYEKGPQSMTFQEAMIKFAQINGHYPRD